MDLRGYLSLISSDSLRIIARNLGQQSEGKTKAELVNLIDRRLSDPAFLKRLLGRLTDAEVASYTLLSFSGEKGLCSQNGTAVAGNRIEVANSLVGKGLVGIRSSYQHEFYYFVPDDLRMLSLRILAPQILSQVETRSPQGLQFQECGLMILRDIFTLLSYIAHREVYLTQKGEIKKRTWNSIAQGFEMKEDMNGPVHPSRRDFILRYCYVRKFIKHTDDGRVRTTGLVNKWLEMSNFERLNDLFFYKDLFPTAKYAFEEGIPALLKAAPARKLFDVASFIEVSFRHCYALGGEKQGSSCYVEALSGVLRILFWLGILKLGVDKDGRPVVLGISKLGESFLQGDKEAGVFAVSTEFFVQPNFELLVPREFDFKLRFQLEQFADVCKIDQMMIYRVHKESIYRALDNGMKKEAIISFLQEHSKTGLPQNVEYSIDEWARSYGKVFFQDVFLLRTTEQNIASEIKASPRLKGFIKGEVCPTALIVERGSYPQLLKKLKKMGYMPRKFKVEEDQSPSPGWESQAETASPFWNSPRENIKYETILEPADLLVSDRPEQQVQWLNIERKQILPLLEYAIQKKKTLLIRLGYSYKGRPSVRKVKPEEIVINKLGQKFLKAYCFVQRTVRMFRVSEITEVRVVD